MPTVAILVAGAGTGPATRTTDAAPSASLDAGAALVPAPADSARVAPRILRVALPEGVAPEKGLQVKTILAARAVSRSFPEILDIGGVRADALKWHPNGMAIDVMIPNYTTPEGKALGDRVVAYVLEHADRLGVHHVIFRQEIHSRRGTRLMADRGSATANHYDHVHIATDGGGFPTGSETYLM